MEEINSLSPPPHQTLLTVNKSLTHRLLGFAFRFLGSLRCQIISPIEIVVAGKWSRINPATASPLGKLQDHEAREVDLPGFALLYLFLVHRACPPSNEVTVLWYQYYEASVYILTSSFLSRESHVSNFLLNFSTVFPPLSWKPVNS